MLELEPSGRQNRQEQKLESKIEVLESRLRRKDSVIAEISDQGANNERHHLGRHGDQRSLIW